MEQLPRYLRRQIKKQNDKLKKKHKAIIELTKEEIRKRHNLNPDDEIKIKDIKITKHRYKPTTEPLPKLTNEEMDELYFQKKGRRIKRNIKPTPEPTPEPIKDLKAPNEIIEKPEDHKEDHKIICNGILNNGSKCFYKAKYNGLCGIHKKKQDKQQDKQNDTIDDIPNDTIDDIQTDEKTFNEFIHYENDDESDETTDNSTDSTDSSTYESEEILHLYNDDIDELRDNKPIIRFIDNTPYAIIKANQFLPFEVLRSCVNGQIVRIKKGSYYVMDKKTYDILTDAQTINRQYDFVKKAKELKTHNNILLNENDLLINTHKDLQNENKRLKDELYKLKNKYNDVNFNKIKQQKKLIKELKNDNEKLNETIDDIKGKLTDKRINDNLHLYEIYDAFINRECELLTGKARNYNTLTYNKLSDYLKHPNIKDSLKLNLNCTVEEFKNAFYSIREKRNETAHPKINLRNKTLEEVLKEDLKQYKTI